MGDNMIGLTILLAALCLVLLLRVYALERNLRDGARQLKSHRAEESGAPLRLAAPNAAAEALFSEVNGLLGEREGERKEFRSREQALREQIANVSHDLRTPLTSILGYLQLLERGDLTGEERQEYLRVIRGRAGALQDLIAGFYDLSRLESGEYPIGREEVDLSALLAELAAAYYSELMGSGMEVSVEPGEGLPKVWGDKPAAERVFSNLLRNALEHGSQHLNMSLRSEEGCVVSRFANGAGELSAEDARRVFDRSFTSDRTRSGHNAGLGLAIVKALCERMDCPVRAWVEEGQFIVEIVWRAASPQAQ